MKKLLLIFTFCILFNSGYSKINDDYTLFIEGKHQYEKKDFEGAKDSFEILLRSYSKSEIFKTNYPYFYIGMTYYNLKDYEKSAYYLEKAVFLEDDFLGDYAKVIKDHFFAQRDFSLGDSLIKLGDIEKGSFYLGRVNYDTFYPMVSYYEKKALEILSPNFPQAKNRMRLKFEGDFSTIDNFSKDELLNIANFFKTKREYQSADKIYSHLLSKKNSLDEKEKILTSYFDFLIESDNTQKILELAKSQEAELKDLYNYYRALSFYEKRDFTRALYLFSTIEDTPKNRDIFSSSNFYIASIYFSLGQYEDSLNALIKTRKKDITTDTMAIFSYLSTKNNEKLKNSSKILEEKYKNEYIGLYFKFIEKNIAQIDFNSLSNLTIFSSHILENLKPLPPDFLHSADILEMEKLSEVAELKDSFLLTNTLKKSGFWKKQSPQSAYAITKIFENGDFYSLAFKNSMHNLGDFANYLELFKYAFPLYYNEEVDRYTKLYDVPQELVYTIMHDITEFNPNHISKNSRLGIMDINYSKDDNLDFLEYFDVDKNIEMGVKKLKTLLDKYEGNKLKTLIAYTYGEEYLKNLTFDSTKDINLATIIDPRERFFLQNLLMTYIIYSRLYFQEF